MIPWILVIALLLAAGAGWQGFRLGKDSVIADQAREQKIFDKGVQAAQLGAAQAIATIKVTNTTIRQKAEKEIIREPIYRDCRHPEPVFRMLDAALTQTPLGAEPPGGGELPDADSTVR